MKGLEEENALRLFGLLVEARRWMNLFQHHDGITGTSKDEVMADYGQKFVLQNLLKNLFGYCNVFIAICFPESLIFE